MNEMSAARAVREIADHRTPLIRDAGYIAGFSHEFSRTSSERVLLGDSVLFYRREDGRPVALQNRCPHRSFPLSQGCLEGDNVRCGYHGLTFNAEGDCVSIPQQPVIPASVRLVRYEVVEQKPFVWIFMGDPAQAASVPMPQTPWLDSTDWDYARNYLALGANYVGLHENLLDLSHFTYLHPTTLGTPEYAKAPFEVAQSGDHVMISRLVPDCAVPPVYARTGMKGRMSRHTKSEFMGAGWHHASAVLTDLEAAPGARREFTVLIDHFMTPETQDTTHYWFTFARDFALGDEEVTQYMERGAMTAFNEDVFALQEITRLRRLEQNGAPKEIDIKSDAAGIAARRVLARLAAR